MFAKNFSPLQAGEVGGLCYFHYLSLVLRIRIRSDLYHFAGCKIFFVDEEVGPSGRSFDIPVVLK
jgi:hypothetical protein